MKYIEVVKTVYEAQMKKEASVKKLAGIIGMKKKAADAKDTPKGGISKLNPPPLAHEVRPPVVDGEALQVKLDANQRALRGWKAPQNIWNQWAPLAGLSKSDTGTGMMGSLSPQNAYLKKSLQARNMLNPFGAQTKAGQSFNKAWGNLHDWKTSIYNKFGILPTFRKATEGGFKFSLPGIPQKEAQQYFKKDPTVKNLESDLSEFGPAIQHGLKQRIADPKDSIHEILKALSPDLRQHFKKNPSQLMLLLSKNTRKPSYSQQLYS